MIFDTTLQVLEVSHGKPLLATAWQGILQPFLISQRVVTWWRQRWMDTSPLRAPSHLLWLPRCPYTADVRLGNWKNRVVMRWMIHLCWRSHQGQASPSSTPRSSQWRKTLGQQPNSHSNLHLPSSYTEMERGKNGSWEDLELRWWYFIRERRCVHKYQHKPFYDSMKGEEFMHYFPQAGRYPAYSWKVESQHA